ncbi:hypothetical protein [Chryseobacterium sp. CT-SW4]
MKSVCFSIISNQTSRSTDEKKMIMKKYEFTLLPYISPEAQYF